MAVNPVVEVRTAMLDAMRASVAGGTMELLSASNQVLAVFDLSDDACSVAAGVWSVEFDPVTTLGTAAAGLGTNAAAARFKNSNGAVRLTGLTVTLPGGSGDVKLINTSITEGQTVAITSASIPYPGV